MIRKTSEPNERANEGKLTVLLCDDHLLFREGARRILDDNKDLAVVGDVASIEDAAEIVGTLAPDVIVVDISLGSGINGIDGIELLKARYPEGKILMVSMHHERSFVLTAIAHGASGYITKDAAAVELSLAVREVASGKQYIPRSITERNEPSTQLTSREREVLELLAAGHTNSEIATCLFLSIRTVESYRFQLNQKLDVNGRAELIRVAKIQGIL
ncbi:response regulator transcription factor [Haloechinothrix salitolerans]